MRRVLTCLVTVWLAFLVVHAAPPQQAAAPAPQDLPVIPLNVGVVIDRSVRVKPGVYRLTAKAPADAPVVTIKGRNITVDLTGVTIEGGEPYADPDTYRGIGILVDAVNGVTIRGGAVRGYAVGLLARRAPGLHLIGLDASYNWKPRLWSGLEKESLRDWLSYHDNEKDEWLRYGAGIYLSECNEAEIENARAVQNQNGLLVTKSARVRLWNNTFSFNSGLGIGMYRVSDSTVMHNKLDWNVRGYSHGFYHRGQDSASLLMYEQSSNNRVAFNSATHGGDGLFLWAGQSTMDTGKGGANDNLFVGNDFSHAVANGVETTFSRNQFIRNRIDDSWHGVWAGYSYDTVFLENSFSGNDEAIAIEHGQNITIARNKFNGDQLAVRIWANATQDPNWGYPKTRDTRSRDYQIDDNAFIGNKTGIDVSRTTGVQVRGNKYDKVGASLQTGVDVKNLAFETAAAPAPPAPPVAITPLPNGMNAMLPVSVPRGRSTMIVDEWGPYDYLSPKIWPAGKITDTPIRLRVLGPAGKWTLKSIRGGTASTKAGSVPGEFQVAPAGPGLDLDVTLEYVGALVTSPRGQVILAGTPNVVTYRVIEPVQTWAVSWWTFDGSTDPVAVPPAFAARLKTPPAKTETLPRLDFLSSRSLSADLPVDRVAMRAETTIRVPAGSLQMFVMSDDGVRVWVDDKLIVDRWTIHETAVDRIVLAPGNRRIRLEYFEMVGWAELQVRFGR